MNKNLVLYLGILIFGTAAPFIFPAFKVQLSILCVLIVLALTWNIQGGEMGYNTFGNILFYGLGMYLCASVQVGMFFPLAEWTESGGEKTFVHTPTQFFQGMAAGLVVAAIVPTIIAGLIGYSILGLRGQDVLYNNNGDGTFKDVTKESGLYKEKMIVTTGVSSADVNKDGFIDLFITTIASEVDPLKKKKTLAPNLLYINNGDGTFSDFSSKYGITKNNFSTSSSFGDINADGYPDLFVGNYFKNFYFEDSPFNTHNIALLNHYSINEEYETGDDELFINVEGKYFKEVLKDHLVSW